MSCSGQGGSWVQIGSTPRASSTVGRVERRQWLADLRDGDLGGIDDLERSRPAAPHRRPAGCRSPAVGMSATNGQYGCGRPSAAVASAVSPLSTTSPSSSRICPVSSSGPSSTAAPVDAPSEIGIRYHPGTSVFVGKRRTRSYAPGGRAAADRRSRSLRPHAVPPAAAVARTARGEQQPGAAHAAVTARNERRLIIVRASHGLGSATFSRPIPRSQRPPRALVRPDPQAPLRRGRFGTGGVDALCVIVGRAVASR